MHCAVAIMAKASVAGTVKTRLVPPLTDAEAAELNSCFLTDVAGNLLAAANQVAIQGFVAYHPLGSEEFFHNLLPGGSGPEHWPRKQSGRRHLHIRAPDKGPEAAPTRRERGSLRDYSKTSRQGKR